MFIGNVEKSNRKNILDFRVMSYYSDFMCSFKYLIIAYFDELLQNHFYR